ncbi:MAG: ABC transporter permease [Chloroflexi bacterium]|nr:ABC transporter permease [Chloroflexota bacterium]MCI0578136.1 ABC transporter permease [Chloroflexota bacterium]MCI0649628.1 ABC transporter permease [Chloroflexota bacterium]MCI0727911.1 ABC transporter permease [Chloroflexota bacterium]
MLNSRLLSLIRKEFIQIRRDPRTLALTFLLPVIQLFLLGYAATNDVRNVPLAVFDQDKSAASRELLDAYRAADYFQIAFDVNSEEEIERLIENNSARAGMIIPPEYSERVTAGTPVQIAFIIDGSDPTVANQALATANLIAQSQAIDLAVERLAARGQGQAFAPAVEARTQVWYNPDLVSAYYMIPALIGIILQVLAVMLTATAIVREREHGTIEQLIVTPIRSWELVAGKVIPYVLLAFFDAIEILVAGVILFGVPINGSIPLLLALSGLFILTTLGLGIFISTVANTQQEAMLLTMFTLLPSIFLSGFFFPLAAMPRVLQWISYAVPLRYFLIIVRGIVLKGAGLEALGPEVFALALFGIAIMAAATGRFRKRLD